MICAQRKGVYIFNADTINTKTAMSNNYLRKMLAKVETSGPCFPFIFAFLLNSFDSLWKDDYTLSSSERGGILSSEAPLRLDIDRNE